MLSALEQERECPLRSHSVAAVLSHVAQAFLHFTPTLLYGLRNWIFVLKQGHTIPL